MFRGVAQPGSAPGLGPGGREFESLRPDHLLFQIYDFNEFSQEFIYLKKTKKKQS